MRYTFPVSVDIYEASRRRAFYPQKICNAPINRGTVYVKGARANLSRAHCGNYHHEDAGGALRGIFPSFHIPAIHLFVRALTSATYSPPAKLCHVFRVEFGLRMYVTPRIGFNGHAGKGGEGRGSQRNRSCSRFLSTSRSPPRPQIAYRL